MMEKCKTKEGLCQCVDWKNGTAADWIDHIMRDYRKRRKTPGFIRGDIRRQTKGNRIAN